MLRWFIVFSNTFEDAYISFFRDAVIVAYSFFCSYILPKDSSQKDIKKFPYLIITANLFLKVRQ